MRGPDGRRAHAGIVALLACALVSAGGLAATLVLRAGVPAALRSGTDPDSAPVVVRAFDDARTVTAQFDFAQDRVLEAPRPGRVTAAGVCADGAAIESGRRVLDLDDRPLIALHTSTPLWRELAVGARGNDVRALQEELARLGSSVLVDGRYGRSTHGAVRDLLERNGLALPADAPLDPADILWVPAEEIAAVGCEVELGARVDAHDVLVRVPGALRGIELLDLPAGALAGARLLDLGDLVVRTDAGGAVVDPAELRLVAESPLARVLLEQEAGPRADFAWVLADPVELTGVPPRSLIDLSAGSGCVSHGGRAYQVQVVSSSLGTSLVTFEEGITPPESVDLDPAGGPCA